MVPLGRRAIWAISRVFPADGFFVRGVQTRYTCPGALSF